MLTFYFSIYNYIFVVFLLYSFLFPFLSFCDIVLVSNSRYYLCLISCVLFMCSIHCFLLYVFKFLQDSDSKFPSCYIELSLEMTRHWCKITGNLFFFHSPANDDKSPFGLIIAIFITVVLVLVIVAAMMCLMKRMGSVLDVLSRP